MNTYLEELLASMPTKFELCDQCAGSGTHWNAAFSDGITEQEREDNWDDESWADLMGGAYDVRCEECDGMRVVRVIDEDRATSDQIAEWLGACEDFWQMEQYEAMERRIGC